MGAHPARRVSGPGRYAYTCPACTVHPGQVHRAPIVLRLPFTRPPITANEARSASSHWAPQHAAKRTVEAAVIAVVRQARVPRLGRVRVLLTWFAPDNGIRDPGLLAPMLKACVDALTPARLPLFQGTPTNSGAPRKRTYPGKAGAGIITADDARVVDMESMRIVLSDPDPRIELRIDPV